MVEAVGFRLTSDVVGVICMAFALLYFATAGGPAAFRSTCKKRRGASMQSNEARDNDYFRMKGEQDDTSHVSRKSKSSNSFCMVGPASPGLQRLRINSIVEELAPAVRSSAFVNLAAGDDQATTPTRSKRRHRAGRLYSDIDGTQSPDQAIMINNDIKDVNFRLQRTGSMVNEDQRI